LFIVIQVAESKYQYSRPSQEAINAGRVLLTSTNDSNHLNNPTSMSAHVSHQHYFSPTGLVDDVSTIAKQDTEEIEVELNFDEDEDEDEDINEGSKKIADDKVVSEAQEKGNVEDEAVLDHTDHVHSFTDDDSKPTEPDIVKTQPVVMVRPRVCSKSEQELTGELSGTKEVPAVRHSEVKEIMSKVCHK